MEVKLAKLGAGSPFVGMEEMHDLSSFSQIAPQMAGNATVNVCHIDPL